MICVCIISLCESRLPCQWDSRSVWLWCVCVCVSGTFVCCAHWDHSIGWFQCKYLLYCYRLSRHCLQLNYRFHNLVSLPSTRNTPTKQINRSCIDDTRTHRTMSTMWMLYTFRWCGCCCCCFLHFSPSSLSTLSLFACRLHSIHSAHCEYSECDPIRHEYEYEIPAYIVRS